MDAGRSPAAEAGRAPMPLTERILERSGGARWLWITAWAMVPLVSPLLFATAIRLSGGALDDPGFVDLAATQVVLAYGCFVLLWGSGLLGSQASDLRRDLSRLAPAELPAKLFQRIDSVRGPLVLTAVVVLVVSAGGWAKYGPLPPLAALLPLAVYLIPILTFMWVYLTILVDLDRLGRVPLALDLFPQDRTLGLQRLGSLASTGLGLLLVASVPVLLAGSDEPVTLGVSLALVGLAVATFLLSMWRLHRQMAAAKARHVATARDLIAEAYAPVRADPRLETLSAQSGALGAAQALEERAEGLPTWPLDEGTLKFIAVVVTGVITSVIVRGLFAALGF